MHLKIKKLFIKPLFSVCSILAALVFFGIAYLQTGLPDDFYVYEGKALKVQAAVPIFCEPQRKTAATESKQAAQGYSVQLKAFGIIPVKSAEVSVIGKRSVQVKGSCFGIKIYTKGVMVVKLDTVDTENGPVDVAAEAGVKLGDTILKINGQAVGCNEEVAKIIEESEGADLKFEIRRENKTLTLTVKPQLSYSSGKYKAGIWVRDSSAGVGTATFYSPSYEVLCGLGHGVYDSDTGDLLPVQSGELVGAEIIGIQKGTVGCPGQLEGVFQSNTLGAVALNSNTGIYAKTALAVQPEELTEVALKQEVQPGEAQILATVDGNAVKSYSCKIEKVTYNNQKTKNLVLKITDKALLEKTGGIVQGMSGSPILQNGKLVGAVTHVLVDDPTTGYGIFAENMLESAEKAAEKRLKAS